MERPLADACSELTLEARLRGLRLASPLQLRLTRFGMGVSPGAGVPLRIANMFVFVFGV